MDGLNAAFMLDSIGFIHQRAIDNMWAGFAQGMVQNIFALNDNRFGNFDLQHQGNNQRCTLIPIRNILPQHDAVLSAYWCPFIHGQDLPGFVDIPMIAPRFNFMFTVAMNGCSLVATQVNNHTIRIYHDRHLNVADVNNLIIGQDHPIRSMITFDDYGTEDHPNAFNFLYYRNGGWRYVIQPQTVIVHDAHWEINRNGNLPIQVIDV